MAIEVVAEHQLSGCRHLQLHVFFTSVYLRTPLMRQSFVTLLRVNAVCRPVAGRMRGYRGSRKAMARSNKSETDSSRARCSEGKGRASPPLCTLRPPGMLRIAALALDHDNCVEKLFTKFILKVHRTSRLWMLPNQRPYQNVRSKKLHTDCRSSQSLRLGVGVIDDGV